MPPQANSSPAAFRWRLGLTLVLAVYGWICLRSPGTYRWLDSLDLAIHESGHLVFAPGGETLGVMGGTLMQLIMPSVFAGALWRQGDLHGATVPLWWLGQNCWNISVYIRDARLQALPLVGGGEGLNPYEKARSRSYGGQSAYLRAAAPDTGSTEQ
ncbi:MAG: hypothetical protein ACJ8AM_13905 [Gemmatimonadales bacterium]